MVLSIFQGCSDFIYTLSTHGRPQLQLINTCTKKKSFQPSLVKEKIHTTERISIERGVLYYVLLFFNFQTILLTSFLFISNFKPQSNPGEFQEAIQFLFVECFSSFSSPTISPLRLFMGASFQIFNSSYFFSRCYLFKMEKNCFQTLKLFFSPPQSLLTQVCHGGAE